VIIANWSATISAQPIFHPSDFQLAVSCQASQWFSRTPGSRCIDKDMDVQWGKVTADGQFAERWRGEDIVPPRNIGKNIGWNGKFNKRGRTWKATRKMVKQR
jgi:hypothetical protein